MATVSGLCATPSHRQPTQYSTPPQPRRCIDSFTVPISGRKVDYRLRIRCSNSGNSDSTGIQVYRDFERLVTETVKQSQDTFGGASNWREAEGCWDRDIQNHGQSCTLLVVYSLELLHSLPIAYFLNVYVKKV